MSGATNYDFLARDDVRPISDTISKWQGVQKNALDIQGQLADKAWGNALQANTDKTTGVVDYGAAKAMAAKNPAAAMGMQRALEGASKLTTDQINQGSAMYNNVTRGSMSIMNDSSDANVEAQRQAMLRAFPGQAQAVNAEFDALKNMAPADRVKSAYSHGLGALSAHDAMVRSPFGETTPQNVGGQIVPGTSVQASPYGSGSYTQGSGGITTTASPDTVVGMPDLVVPATADDVKNGLAKTPGEMIHISGADRVKRYGYTRLLPPGAQEVPGTGGGGAGGVVNSDGTPASSANPPRVRQLNVPGQGQSGGSSGALAPVATPSVAPAPPGGATGTPAPTGNVGIGAALNPPGTASAPAAAIPVPPVPPTSGVPLSGNGGLVRFPNGNVGTPGGGGLGSRSALEGGVPVASTNALAPTVGAGSPPSAAVPGNVNAILQGMANARTTPTPGTQVAGASFSTGPGYDEQVTAKTSQDRLASDTALAANYASNVFPQTQALSLLGRGMTTAPGSDFLNTAKGWAGGVYRSMGGTGVFDETKEYDSVHKWLSQIVAGNPVAQGSDARLAATLAGNANTGIHELASADMLKAGIALMRMNATASSEWKSNPAVRQQYGYYTDYLRDFNRTVDPRAFAWDMYNEAQKKDLAADLDKHDEAYAQRLHNSLQMVRRNGYMGEIRAMP